MTIQEFHLKSISLLSILLQDAVKKLDADSKPEDLHAVHKMTDILCDLIRFVKNP